MRVTALGIIALVLIVPFVVHAAPTNGDAHVLQCTLTTGEKCLDGKCSPLTSIRKIALPLKVGVEFAAGVIAATDLEGWPMVSPIEKVSREPGQMILQGTGFGVGWTMAIEEIGTRATATMNAADGVSVLFGTCTPEPEE